MADILELNPAAESEPNGHVGVVNGDTSVAANGISPTESTTDSNPGRAKHKTVLLGGSFTQQIRGALGLDQDEDADDGFVRIRPAGTTPTAIRRSAQQLDARPAAITEVSQGMAYNSAARPVRTDLSPLVGFLVSYDKHSSGEVYELRLGRWIVSSAATMADNFLVIDDDSISHNHATLRINSGTDIQVIDQFSDAGTAVTRSDAIEEEKVSIGAIKHGDIVRFGTRSFHVSIVSKA